MRHKPLYSIRPAFSAPPTARNVIVEAYRRIKGSRHIFALSINALGVRDKYPTSPVGEGLRDQLCQWKRQYNGLTSREPTSRIIERRYRGRLFSVTVDNVRDYKGALNIIKRDIRARRARDKEIFDILSRRAPNGLLREFQGRRLKMPKKPMDDADYIGIEIECITPENADTTVLLPFSKYIEVGGDGSIDHSSNEKGTEVRVCMRRDEVRDVLPGLMSALKSLGARINKSCGLHVHIDQRNNAEPEKAFQKLVRSLGLLYTVVPTSRRRNTYCKRNRHSNFDRAIRGDRYKAINARAFRRYQTIEVRLFGGSLEARKIINWIEVLLAIAYGETVLRCPKSFDTALKYWKLSTENLTWLKDRQARFSSLNVGMPISEHETEENQMLLDENATENDENRCGECDNHIDDCTCNAE